MCYNKACLKVLDEIHELQPTLRICQIISNIFTGRDMFYTTDKALYAELNDVLIQIKGGK